VVLARGRAALGSRPPRTRFTSRAPRAFTPPNGPGARGHGAGLAWK